jgi:hypothetical protein
MLGEAIKGSEFLDPNELFPIPLAQKGPGYRIVMLTPGVAAHGEPKGFFADTLPEVVERLLLKLESRPVNTKGFGTAADRFQLIRAQHTHILVICHCQSPYPIKPYALFTTWFSTLTCFIVISPVQRMSKEKPPFLKKIEKKRSFFDFVGIQLGFITLQDRMPSVMLAQE